MNKEKQQIIAALESCVRRATRNKEKYLNDEKWSSAAEAEAFVNGLEQAKAIVEIGMKEK